MGNKTSKQIQESQREILNNQIQILGNQEMFEKKILKNYDQLMHATRNQILLAREISEIKEILEKK